MSLKSKAEKEKERVAQEKAQTILTSMLRDEDNKYCVDCDSKGPRWASWNLGVFLCIRCAGIHRNLGVHISKVKSVNLDSWTPQQVASMQSMGNSKGRAVYEANIPDDFRRPQADSNVETFIRQKYEKKKFIAAEWVATKPPEVPVGWDEVGGGDLKKVEFKKLTLPTRSQPNVSPKPEAKTTVSSSTASLTVSLPPVISSSTPATVAASTVTDLLGLTVPSTASAFPPSPNPAPSSSSQDLLGLNSEFSAFVSASPSVPPKVNEPEPSLKSQIDVTTPSDGRMSKDSILALFGPKSSPLPSQPQNNIFGQFQSPGISGMPQFPSQGQSQPQFQSPNPGLGNFQSPASNLGTGPNPLGTMGSHLKPSTSCSPNIASVSNGKSPHSDLLGLYNQPQQPMMNGFQNQSMNNPFLETNQMSGQLAGLNLGQASTATASPSLWQ